MKKREFDKVIAECSNVSKGKRQLDGAKVTLLPVGMKDALVAFLVRNRGPIIAELLHSATDMGWLGACGYLFRTQGKRFVFLHTREQEKMVRSS